MKKIYTLGTGRRSEEDFIEILFAYDIKTLVDVRSFPKSKMPVFTRENLENLLKKEGINYVFFGRELGGFRKGGYEAYTETDDFRKGIDKLEQIALQSDRKAVMPAPFVIPAKAGIQRNKDWMPHQVRHDMSIVGHNTVVVCAERFPWKCHRRWISRELHRRGWQVEHIIDKGKVWTPKG
ncbi:MAG: DUF488 domain-containing protein [Thermodesulfovibrionales bacterium]